MSVNSDMTFYLSQGRIFVGGSNNALRKIEEALARPYNNEIDRAYDLNTLTRAVLLSFSFETNWIKTLEEKITPLFMRAIQTIEEKRPKENPSKSLNYSNNIGRRLIKMLNLAKNGGYKIKLTE